MNKRVYKYRHVLKTVTWRVVGTIDTVIIGWFLTGDPTLGLSIGSIELITKMILYYTHERIWYKINFGIKDNDGAQRTKRFFRQTG